MLARFGILNVIFILSIALSIQSQATAATKPVKKILSLDLCTDWMLAKYASPSQVLALSPLMKQYPVDWVGQDWPTHNGSLEQILRLKPDLVLTGEFNALMLRRRLQELGVRVEILPLPKSLSQVSEHEQRLLSLIGKSKDNASKPPRLKPSSHPKQRLLLLGANGIGTGRNTFEDDILRYAGWDNYLLEKGYINLDLERIATDPPDAILWSAPSSAALSNLFAKHPVLKRAIPSNRWLVTKAWNWQCPGPWTWDLIEQLQASAQR
jgi:iron complex transport system substrate-binding protein